MDPFGKVILLDIFSYLFYGDGSKCPFLPFEFDVKGQLRVPRVCYKQQCRNTTETMRSLPGWHTFTVDLQHKILARMRGLGMTPILPAFAGHVPKGLVDLFKPNYTELVI